VSSFQSEIRQLAKWFEVGVLAETVLELEGVDTVEKAQKVWLDFLATGLNEGLKSSVRALQEKGEL
jgi:hypothetical protein